MSNHIKSSQQFISFFSQILQNFPSSYKITIISPTVFNYTDFDTNNTFNITISDNIIIKNNNTNEITYINNNKTISKQQHKSSAHTYFETFHTIYPLPL